MKTKNIIKILPLMFTMAPAFSQTAAERLEQGVQLQTADGNFEGAIAEYREVLKNAARSQRLAAEARYRMAECYAKLGNEARMKDQLKALQENFPADNKWVVKAIELSPKEWAFEGIPWKDGELNIYAMTLSNGNSLGGFMTAIRKVKNDPETWESIVIRSGGSRSLSNSIFTTKDYRCEKARWTLEMFGDITSTFGKDGVVTMVESSTGEDKGTYDHSKAGAPEIPMFENEQAIQLIRALKQEIGTKQKTIVSSAFSAGIPIAFNLEVTGHEEIETPAGKFSCAKIETNVNQTFYVSRGEGRELVRMDMSVAKVDLVSTEKWSEKETQKIHSEAFGMTMTLPAAMLASAPNVDKEVYRVQLWSTDFAGKWGLLEINKKSNLLPEAQKGSEEFAKVLHEGFEKNFDEFEVATEWDEIEVDGVTAVGMKVRAKKADLVTRYYQVYAVGEEEAMSFRLEYSDVDEERAIARSKEIVEKFRW